MTTEVASGRPDAPKIFVSYARANLDRVDALVSGVSGAGINVWIDTSSIEPTADWQAEIRRAAESSDATVVFMSREFFASAHCADELQWIAEGGKKVIPVALEDISKEYTEAWPWLRSLNWIIADASGSGESVVGLIVRAVHADLDWANAHARLLVRAREWDLQGRPRARLLRGTDISSAEEAVVRDRPAEQPQPTELQRAYVAASRQARGRSVRIVTGTAVVVALVSTGLAVVALQQRQTALTSLAISDYRRLSSEAESATTQSDALRLALDALEQSGDAGEAEADAVVPLTRALSRADVPLMHFVGLPDSQQASGGRQGTAVSGDGSTLAYATSDGGVHVVDLWELRERMVVEPFAGALTDYGAGYQVGLDWTGSRLVRVVVPEYPEDGESFVGAIEVYDLTGRTADRISDVQVALGSPAAGVSFGPEESLLAIAEEEGTATIVDISGEAPDAVHLGTPEMRDSASYLKVNFSRDGSRLCTLGARLQLFEVDTATQLVDVDGGYAFGQDHPCIPEPCGIEPDNVMVFDELDQVLCIGADGSTRGQAFATSSSELGGFVALQGLEELAWDGAEYDSWSVAQPTGELVAPPYWWLEGPDEMVRPLALGFAVPGPTGPALVNVGVDGDIDVWSVGAGILPMGHSVVGAEGVVRAPGGQVIDSDGNLLGLSQSAESQTVVVVDVASGEEVEPAFSLPGDPTAYDTRSWFLSDGALLAVARSGSVVVTGDDGDQSYELDVPDDDGVSDPPVEVEGDRLIYSSGSAVRVVDAHSGETIFESSGREDGETYCAVGVSPGGLDAVAVTCGGDGVAEVEIWSGLGGDAVHRETPVRHRQPSSAAVADGGNTAAVGFGSGEVEIFTGEQLLLVPELTTVSASHNDYQGGWVALDASGGWLVTRRDARGIELWRVSDGQVRRAALLSLDDNSPAPLARLTAGSLSVHWSAGAGNAVIEGASWSFTADSLRAEACRRIAAVTEAGDQNLVSPPPCEALRGVGRRPEPGDPPSPDPSLTDADSERLPYDPIGIELAGGSFPNAVTITDDGAVWVSASSSLVRIVPGSDPVINPIGESRGADQVAAAADGAIWFSGFQTFGWMERDGEVSLLREPLDPSALTADEDGAYAFVGPVDPQLIWATQESVRIVPLADVDGMSAVALTTAEDHLWMALVRSDAEPGPALGRLEDDGGVEVIALEGLTNLTALASAADDSLWFAGMRDDSHGVIGHRTPDGAVDYVDLPPGLVASELTAEGDGVLFTSDTHLGAVDTQGELRVWSVPDAEQLSGIALAADRSIWLTDSQGDTVIHLVPPHGD